MYTHKRLGLLKLLRASRFPYRWHTCGQWGQLRQLRRGLPIRALRRWLGLHANYDYTETHLTDKLPNQESTLDYFGAHCLNSISAD